MRVDAHQHFWRYDAADYSWIEPGSGIDRDFLPEDLRPLLDAAAIDGCIAVQARQHPAETDWLLALSAQAPWILGVVGWLPLEDDGIGELLDRYRASRLLGLRHVVQDEPDPEFLLRPGFNRGVRAVGARGLSYDLLITASQLPQAIVFADRHPELRLVLDHAAKPEIRRGGYASWRPAITDLAAREQCWCKVSGLVTEADHAQWTEAELRPYLDALLEAFGPRRLLFGSDWPVCTLASSHHRWWRCVEDWAVTLSDHERTDLFGGNAHRAYRLET